MPWTDVNLVAINPQRLQGRRLHPDRQRSQAGLALWSPNDVTEFVERHRDDRGNDLIVV